MFTYDELWVLSHGQTQVLGSDLDLEAPFSSVSKVSGYQTSVMSIAHLKKPLCQVYSKSYSSTVISPKSTPLGRKISMQS